MVCLSSSSSPLDRIASACAAALVGGGARRTRSSSSSSSGPSTTGVSAAQARTRLKLTSRQHGMRCLSLSHCHISFARLTGQGSGGQVLRGVFEPLGQHRRRLLEARHPRSRSCRRNRRSRRLASLGRRRRRRRCCRAGSAGARPQGAQRGAHAAGGGNGYRRGVGQRRHQRQRRARGVAQRALARHVVLERLGARWLLQHAPMVA